jgi:hypothetical protein
LGAFKKNYEAIFGDFVLSAIWGLCLKPTLLGVQGGGVGLLMRPFFRTLIQGPLLGGFFFMILLGTLLTPGFFEDYIFAW